MDYKKEFVTIYESNLDVEPRFLVHGNQSPLCVWNVRQGVFQKGTEKLLCLMIHFIMNKSCDPRKNTL